MEKVQHLGAADAGEKVFVAAGKTDHLMREHRPKDHRLIVVVDRAIDFHRHIHLKPATRQFANRRGGNGADVAQHIGVVPFMIMKGDVGVLAAAFVERDLQPLANRPLAHRVMGAEGDHHVQLRHGPADLRVDGLEELAHRCRTRVVRHDEQHLFAGIIRRRQSLGHDTVDLAAGQRRVSGCGLGDCTHVKSSAPKIRRPPQCPSRSRSWRPFHWRDTPRRRQVPWGHQNGPLACDQRLPWPDRSACRPR